MGHFTHNCPQQGAHANLINFDPSMEEPMLGDTMPPNFQQDCIFFIWANMAMLIFDEKQ